MPGRLDQRVADQLVAEADGNPLALLELPRGLTPAELAGGFGLPEALPLEGSIEDRFLRRLEARAYALSRRLPPDLVIKLMVSPPTAKRREPNMDLEVICDRVASMERLAFPGARVVCVDAEQPLSVVIGKIKREIWRQL